MFRKRRHLVLITVFALILSGTSGAYAVAPTVNSSYSYTWAGSTSATSNPLAGWTTIAGFSGIDDSFTANILPSGFTIRYNGTSYSTLRMSSNSVICFSTCGTNYSNFAPGTPAGPHIEVCANDYDSQYIAYIYDSIAGTFKIRYEGKAHGGSLVATPTAFWEVTFHNNSGTFELGMGTNPLCGTSSAFSDGTSYLGYFISGQTDSLVNKGFQISTEADTVSPTFSSASVNSAGTQLTLTYSEALSATTAPASAFSVIAAGSAVSVSSVSVSGSTVVLSLASAIKIGQIVTVAYTDPSASDDANAIQDLAGNDAATLSPTNVTNNSTTKASQATLTLSSGSATYGTPYRLLASGGSGTGALSYAVTSGPCTISNGDSLTSTSTGTCLVVATKATDANYLVQNSSAATITISAGTSSATVSLQPGSLFFRQIKNVTAVASVAGKISFKANNVFLPGCRNLTANAGNSFTVSCPYKPIVHSAVTIFVILIPTDSSYSSSVTSSANYFVLGRTTSR